MSLLLGHVYTIPDHLRIGSLFISDWGCAYSAVREFDEALLRQSGTTLLRISRWYENGSSTTRADNRRVIFFGQVILKRVILASYFYAN